MEVSTQQYKVQTLPASWDNSPKFSLNINGTHSYASAIGYAIAQHFGCQVRSGFAHGAFHDPNYATSYLKDNPLKFQKCNLDGIIVTHNVKTGEKVLSDPAPITINKCLVVGKKVLLFVPKNILIVDLKDVSVY